MKFGQVQKTNAVLALEENVKMQFLNEYTTEKEYRALTKNEKVLNLAEYAATEYLNTSRIIKTIFNNKKKSDNIFNGLEMKISNTPFFKDIESSRGNIVETANHTKLKTLLKYAIETNASASVKSDAHDSFDKAALTILKCMTHFEKNATKIRQLLMAENTRLNNVNMIGSFYKASVFLIQMTGDMLYSNSIDVKFNTNIKPAVVESISFPYSNGIVDEMLEQIEAINNGFENGKIFKAFNNSLHEDFEDTIEKISLNEDVLDTIFGLVTHFSALDLLVLFPIYLTRSTLYWIGFFYLSFKNVSLDIDRSIEVTRGRNIEVDKFNRYVVDSRKKANVLQNSFQKASAAIDMDASSDKKALTTLSRSSQNSVLI